MDDQPITTSDGTDTTDQLVITTPTTNILLFPPPNPTTTTTTPTYTTTAANFYPPVCTGTIPKYSISSPIQQTGFNVSQNQPPLYTNPYPYYQQMPNQFPPNLPTTMHAPYVPYMNVNQPPISMHATLPNVSYASAPNLAYQAPNLAYQASVTNNAQLPINTAQPPHTNNAQTPNQGSTASTHRPVGVNIERLYYQRSNIPNLGGYVNNQWEGISVTQWLSMVNNYFKEEKIDTDYEKLITYLRFVDLKSTTFAIIQASQELSEATSWEAFSKSLTNILNPLTVESSFEFWSKYRHMDWSKESVLQVFCAKVQKILDDFEISTFQHFGAKFNPKMKRIITFATIYDCTPLEHRHKVVQFFNADLEYSDQIREYMSKTGNILEYPFSNSRTRPSPRLSRECTVSNVQSYSQVTRKPALSFQQKPNKDKHNQSKTQVDPYKAPKCFQCERYGHYTDKCIFKPFCSSCKDYHPRGSQQQCANTSWNFRTPEALLRVQYILPNFNKGKTFNSSRNQPQPRRPNSRGNPSQPNRQIRRNTRSNSSQRTPRPNQSNNQVHYMQEDLPMDNLHINSEDVIENQAYNTNPLNETSQEYQLARPNSPYPYQEQNF
ncbi:UNVERIFIED_CONTAM: hypothetical protein RMT77_000822 [Armadillidium vulgare]